MAKFYGFVRKQAIEKHSIDVDSIFYHCQLADLQASLPPGDVIILPYSKNGQFKQLNGGSSGYRKVIVKETLT